MRAVQALLREVASYVPGMRCVSVKDELDGRARILLLHVPTVVEPRGYREPLVDAPEELAVPAVGRH